MIILIGMAGTGKSTQGERLAKKFGWKWVSAGQMLRDSGKFKAEQNAGKLVDLPALEEFVLRPVVEMEKAGEQVILDGLPRGREQAEWLMEQEDLVREVELVICLVCDPRELEQRLLERGRADDTPEVIRRRIEGDKVTVMEVVGILRRGGVRVEEVDAAGTRDEVQERIEKILEKV